MSDFEDYVRVLARLDPGARLERHRTLHGGLSATMVALEFRGADEAPRRAVLRRLGTRTQASDRLDARQQFELLRLLRSVALPVPEPLLLDESRRVLGEPYLLLGYIEGALVSAPSDPAAYARALARQLAELHARTRGLTDACSFLPSAPASVEQLLAGTPFASPPTYPQRVIREVLARAWPLASRNPPSVLHGDFHSGNVLWRHGVLAGVLDWADALVGDPLADIGGARLDLLWMLGEAAVQTFTDTYAAQIDCDLAQLPYWDLVATLRPGSRLGAWASVWPEQERPDITEQTMSADRDAFAKRALESIG